LAVDVSESFSSLGRFWESISALVLAHIVFLVALRYVVGIRFPVRQWIKAAGATERGRETKSLLEEMGLWTKLPLVGIVALLFYFVLFNYSVSLVRNATRFEPVEARFSMIDSWRDHKPLYELEQLAQYAPARTDGTPPDLYDLSNTYYSLLDDYRSRDPNGYSEWTDWGYRQTQTPEFLYDATKLALLVALVGGVFFVVRQRKRIRVRHSVGWLLLVVLLCVVAFPAFRYRVEVKQEQANWNSVSFVVDELRADKKRVKLRSGEQLEQTRKALLHQMCFRKSREQDWETFSLARSVDEMRVLRRLFRATAYGTYPRPAGHEEDGVCDILEPGSDERLVNA
jgi:hypothetical protein